MNSEDAKPMAKAASPARAILRPVFLPKVASSASQMAPRLPEMLSAGFFRRSSSELVRALLTRWNTLWSAPIM